MEQITRLVMVELEKMSPDSPQNIKSGEKTRVLVLLDEETEDLSTVIDVLGKVETGMPDYHIYIPDDISDQVKSCAGFLRYKPIAGIKRASYSRVVSGVDKVILPFLSIPALTKIANLIADDPVSGLSIKALLMDKPLLVCTDNIHNLKYSGARTESKIMALINANLKTLEDLGAQTIQLKSLSGMMGDQPVQKVTTDVGVRNVVTKEDILVASDQKLKMLNFPRRTIITPLANGTATALGIEIRLI
ncbi:MAG: hypothetical protein K8T10_11115 [Candidatus Eremiobacteraeota bacterium]|nr:hypothetical protein [Candidatus Eremiobacteraeota bacterium]